MSEIGNTCNAQALEGLGVVSRTTHICIFTGTKWWAEIIPGQCLSVSEVIMKEFYIYSYSAHHCYLWLQTKKKDSLNALFPVISF